MRRIITFAVASLLVGFAVHAPLGAQGPGSCGFHLDIDANITSTHAAVADLPFAPGSGPTGYPAGLPGNPYAARATPGSVFKLKLSVPPSVIGPAPFGAGSRVTIFWALGTPDIAVLPPPGGIPACVAGQPWILSVLPFAGVVLDGIGIVTPPPVAPPADPGHPNKLEVTLSYPMFMPTAAPIRFQAAAFTPAGLLAVSNGVSIFPGPNPAEASLVPGLIGAGGLAPTDEGYAMGLPTPPGFMFYGFPAPICNVSTNGFVDFRMPMAAMPVDRTGSAGDLGCAPATATAGPRLAVNHFDVDLAVPPPAPLITDLTMEMAPPGPAWPSRLIIRWKNVGNFGLPPAPPDTNYSSMVAELWGMDGPGGWSRLVAVRQEMHSVYSLANHDLIGIGPGVAGQGFGGPPPVCIATPLWPLYGGPGLAGPPLGGIYLDTTPIVPGLLDSRMVSNLAVAFDPMFMGVPGAYIARVY